MMDDKGEVAPVPDDGLAAADEENTALEIGISTDPLDVIECVGCGAGIDTRDVPSFSRVVCPGCKTDQVVPARLGNFRLLDVLGAGGMGAVFLAQDDSLKRHVAVKVLLSSIGEDPVMLESFRREAQAVARLNHPNIVQIYSFGEAKGQPYLVMELLGGDKLEDLIESGQQLDPAFVLRVGVEIAEGLAAAQSASLLHGDIKPENVLFDRQMQAKLVDFGIARVLSAKDSGDEVWGTPFYIAPEKARRQRVDVRSDIYSLGATLYHAIAGVPPFDGEDVEAVIRARFEGPPKSLAELRPGIEPQVVQIIERMMHNDLFLRYPNYLSLIKDMRRFLDGVPDARKNPPTIRRRLMRTSGKLLGETSRGAASGGLSTASQRVSGALSAPGAAQPASGRRKALVVHKGSLNGGTAVPAQTATPGAPGGGQADADNKRSGISPKVWLVLMLVVFLSAILAAVGLVAGMVARERRAEAELQRWYADARAADEALAPLGGRAERAVQALQRRDSEAGRLLEQAGELVRQALSEDLQIPDLEPPPPPGKDPEAVAADGPGEPGAGQPAEPERPVLVRTAERLFGPARAIRALLRDAEAVRDRPLPALPALTAEAMTEALLQQRQERLESREAAIARVEEQVGEADGQLAGMRLVMAELERRGAERLEELRRQEARERDARQAAEEEQARQREAEARRQRIRRDLDQVAALVRQRRTIVQAYDYGRVAREIERARDELATEEGRNALAAEVERFRRLEAFKRFMLADLREHHGVRRGLIQTDVLGADVEAEALLVTGGRRVPLREVTIAQWLNLINLLLEQRPQDRPLGLIEHGEQLFNAAIFCIVHGEGAESARAKAETLARLAVQRRTVLELDVPRILPEVRLEAR